ncbi:MAG: hypothetical protein A2513_09095 [Sulfurimonas sp. RIFOXYD12_FULL_33_39]|uniref:hypothetical protein n=1 Tax=unclassified Sulfurimonas TaxID=2623549 RepID=UPI0008D7C6BE|nr:MULTISPECIES: hypothetical protein [unclassified Sulfurimonas]OHE10235.1 MAG: hypothetical protein A2513_09095 [Sulfurimonas sp. RIFOXYD12_FULL_33_39]OHE14544.1 MAG: hypothetical protein A2530_01385 [Sulfurimonas sp. RIFOXYD2_FULL_34_21]
MSVIFESTIKMAQDSREDWYIELKDTMDGRVETCKDLLEYSKKVEELGALYGGNIDEVRWGKDDNVPPYIIDAVRFEMSKLQKEIEDEIGEPLIGEETK